MKCSIPGILIFLFCVPVSVQAQLPSIPYEVDFAFPTPGESPRGMA